MFQIPLVFSLINLPLFIYKNYRNYKIIDYLYYIYDLYLSHNQIKSIFLIIYSHLDKLDLENK